ncbi:MAG: tyrosine--tRNA ligase [Fusobacteriota bacterium]
MDIKQEVKRQMEILKRGVEELIGEKELEEKLERSLKEDKPLKIKYGIDPTGNSIHIGHAVPIRKLKQFQDLGHTVQFLIGNFTAKIGDPTGKSKTREVLSDEEIKENIKGYLDQISIILDVEKTQVRYNADWLSKLNMEDIFELMAQFTVSKMTSREDFAKRLEANQPVSLVEFMYPIMQGYDSVALECDVELGATEQKFNILRGRDLQKSNDQEPQVCMLMPILEGTDGVEKMSKSLGNYIGLKDEPNDMFGKVMSISDELMIKYYKMVTEIPLEKIEKMVEDIKNGDYHPMNAKKYLAREIVKMYHGEEEAKKAATFFNQKFSKNEVPDDLPEVQVKEDKINIIDLIYSKLEFSESKSQAKRLIKGNAVSIDGKKIKDIWKDVEIKDGMVIKVGKKRMAKLIK